MPDKAKIGPVFLVGFSASGKSTLGHALAERLGVAFVDTDEVIEREHSLSVSDFFKLKGEQSFREAEQDTLREIIGRHRNSDAIIATGGGTVCRPGVMEMLNEAGTTVFLETSVDKITERVLIEQGKRPLMADKNPVELRRKIERSLTLRMPYYAKAVHRFDSSFLESQREISHSVSKFLKDILKITEK